MKTIALLTDLGYRDAYVGAMKGVISSVAPGATILDITHAVPAGAVGEAAFSLYTCFRYFPTDTVFCCVVDPGVGGARRGVAIEFKSEAKMYTLVGPDNGLFTGALYEATDPKAVSLENSAYHLDDVSSTFHARDIFAPVAAHLASGLELEKLGRRIPSESLVQLEWTGPRETEYGWVAETIHADQFGNLVTNLSIDALAPDPSQWQVRVGEVDIGPVRRTFSDVRPKHPLAYVGSSGLLELAIRDGNAQKLLNVGGDATILVSRV